MSREIAEAVSGSFRAAPPPDASRGKIEARSGNDPELAEVVAVTKDMFPGEPAIELMSDPEDPDHPFIVLTVEWSGDVRELIRRRLQWHDRIDNLSIGHFGAFRLSVVPV